jgi:formate--tetrahydrofolate ligase
MLFAESKVVKDDIKRINELGFDKLPVCMAKTQFSLSDDHKKTGRPKDFKLNVLKMKISAGAGFIVCFTGDIMTMPGLPAHPAAENMNIDESGNISGLF